MKQSIYVTLFVISFFSHSLLSAQCTITNAADDFCTVCAGILGTTAGGEKVINGTVTINLSMGGGTFNFPGACGGDPIAFGSATTLDIKAGNTVNLDPNIRITGTATITGNGNAAAASGGTTYSANGTPSFVTLTGEIQSCASNSSCNTLQQALPVTLLSYVAATTKTGVDLAWVTQDETDNEFFTVERSRDGRVFTAVAEIRGQGTTASVTEYKWTDAAPRAGTNYYRLSQTDFDGTHTVLGVVSIGWTGSRVNVTPNPVSAGGTIVLDIEEEGAGGWAELISFDGRRVVSVQLSGANGRQAQLPLDLPRGMYFLRLPNAPEVEPTKLIVK